MLLDSMSLCTFYLFDLSGGKAETDLNDWLELGLKTKDFSFAHILKLTIYICVRLIRFNNVFLNCFSNLSM